MPQSKNRGRQNSAQYYPSVTVGSGIRVSEMFVPVASAVFPPSVTSVLSFRLILRNVQNLVKVAGHQFGGYSRNNFFLLSHQNGNEKQGLSKGMKSDLQF